jgi:16S rRNA (guanine(527)-N(7))-methyltransferase RsmG
VEPSWARAARWVDLDLDSTQKSQLRKYRDWLIEEAIPAGVIGPGETKRIDRRHIGDSLLFAGYFDTTVEQVWDLGTGAGLPGIPLAVALPHISFRLVDRSGRRIALVRRAIRILGLKNCQVVLERIEDLKGKTPVIVSRASLPPDLLGKVAKHHLTRDGVAIVAGSWLTRPEQPGWVTKEIPSDVLDQPIWILIMRCE